MISIPDTSERIPEWTSEGIPRGSPGKPEETPGRIQKRGPRGILGGIPENNQVTVFERILELVPSGILSIPSSSSEVILE